MDKQKLALFNTFTSLALLVILTVFSASFAFGENQVFNLGVINKSMPRINVEFSENVTINAYKLLGLDDGNDYSQSVAVTPSQGFHEAYTFIITNPLPSQRYELSVNYSDDVGHENYGLLLFTIQAPFMNIQLEQPGPGSNFGMANHTPFYLEISTEGVSTCKFLSLEQFCNLENSCDITNQSLLEHAFNNYAFSFDNENALTHYKQDFNSWPVFIQTESNLVEMLMICYYGSQYNPAVMLLGYDTTSPELQVSVNPEVVTDPLVKSAEVVIQSDDAVICKYYDGLVWQDIGDYIVNDLNAYSTVHSITLQFEDYPPGEEHVFNYQVYCRNIAGLSTTQNFTVIVRYEQVLRVNVHMKQYYNSNNVFLNLTTSKEATCDSKVDDGEWQALTTTYSFTHQKQISVSEGAHTLTFACEALDNSEGTATHDFIVDKTPPSKPLINTSQYTCSLSRIQAFISCNDNEAGSGIDYCEYSVSSDQGFIIDWTRTSNNDWFDISLSLEENKTYTIHARCFDKAGNMGQESTAQTIAKTSNTVECDTTPPTTQAIIYDSEGVKAVNITCHDNVACSETFRYAIIGLQDSCDQPDFQEFAYNNLPLYVDVTSKLCWIVTDIAGNEKHSSVIVNLSEQPPQQDHCSNGILDGDETDIDCGGSCAPCLNGMSCLTNEDCISGFCNNGVCAEQQEQDHCSNNVLDGDETDIDCGGSCNPCLNGMSCNSNEDCVSGLCDQGICKEANLDSDNDGLPDAWEEQNGLNPNNPDDGLQDSDDDGLSNLDEYHEGTDPWVADTDGDGASDGAEVEAGTDPLNPESKPKTSWKLIIIIAAIVIVLGGAGGGLYYYKFRKPSQQQALQGFKPGFESSASATSTGGVQQRGPSPALQALRQRIARARALRRAAMREQLLKAFDTGITSKAKTTEPTSESITESKTVPSSKQGLKLEKGVEKQKQALQAQTQKLLQKEQKPARQAQSRQSIEKQGKQEVKQQVVKPRVKTSQSVVKPSKFKEEFVPLESIEHSRQDNVFEQLARLTNKQASKVKSIVTTSNTGFEVAKLFEENKKLEPGRVLNVLQALIDNKHLTFNQASQLVSSLMSKNVLTNQEAANVLKGLKQKNLKTSNSKRLEKR